MVFHEPDVSITITDGIIFVYWLIGVLGLENLEVLFRMGVKVEEVVGQGFCAVEVGGIDVRSGWGMKLLDKENLHRSY